MAKTYELRTIKDIFDKVPSDRIPLCCTEMGLSLGAAKELAERVPGITCPDVHHWVDDGKGEVGFKVSSPDGKEWMRVQLTPEVEVEVTDEQE